MSNIKIARFLFKLQANSNISQFIYNLSKPTNIIQLETNRFQIIKRNFLDLSHYIYAFIHFLDHILVILLFETINIYIKDFIQVI